MAKQDDPFLTWIERWRVRFERCILFLLLILHLGVVTAISFSLVMDHLNIKTGTQASPQQPASGQGDH